MKWIPIFLLTMMIPSALAEPQANESYCIGVNPEHCPYAWTLDGNRWHFDGIPLGREETQEKRREGREEAPRDAREDSGGAKVPPESAN